MACRTNLRHRNHQGAQRGDLPTEGETIEIWGSKYVWESVLKDLEALSRHLWLKDSTMLDKHNLSSIRKTTIQVDVDISCSETFFVSDDRTEEVCARARACVLLLLLNVSH